MRAGSRGRLRPSPGWRRRTCPLALEKPGTGSGPVPDSDQCGSYFPLSVISTTNSAVPLSTTSGSVAITEPLFAPASALDLTVTL